VSLGIFSVVPPTEPCASESEYQGFLLG